MEISSTAAPADPTEIDFVLWASVMGDYYECEEAGRLMRELGIVNAAHWTMSMACASFLPLLAAAEMLIRCGRAKKILIVTATNWVNRIIDQTKDFSLLGDGAAAVVLERSQENSLISISEKTVPAHAEMVTLPSPWRTRTMEVLEFQKSSESRGFLLDGAAVEPARRCLLEGITQNTRPQWTIFSQIGLRAMETWSRSLEMDPKTNLSTLDFTGHLSLTNHPFILHHFTTTNPQIKRGDVILFFGVAMAGYTSSILWRY